MYLQHYEFESQVKTVQVHKLLQAQHVWKWEKMSFLKMDGRSLNCEFISLQNGMQP